MNIIILTAFVLTIGITLFSVRLMVDMMGSINSLQRTMLKQEATLKQDLDSIESTVSKLIIMVTLEQDGIEEQIKVMHTLHAELQENLSMLYSEVSDIQNQEALAILHQMDHYTLSLIENTSTIADGFAFGDQDSAWAALSGGYSEEIAKMRDSISELEALIDSSLDGMTMYISSQFTNISIASSAGGGVVIAFIIMNFLVTFLTVSRLITKISGEINQIISDIKDGKGNLTARIQTVAKNELMYLVNGFNEFINTLQNIMKEVKDGTVVLRNHLMI